MKFKGIIPAIVTPLDQDERINIPVLDKLLEDLLAKGADGFYVAGATGEGIALRPSERRILAERAIEVVNHRKPVIVQVASTDFNEAIALAKHAEASGADAISATAPLFFPYGENEVYNYYKALANAVHIPLIMYYNMAAGFNFSAKFAARVFEIDNVTGIKWTSSNYYQMMLLRQMTHGEMNIINGPDEMLLMGLTSGADAGIGTTYNFMLDVIRGVYDHYVSGDLAKAQEYQDLACRIIGALHNYSTIPATKALLEYQGYAVGNAAFPLKRYTQEEKAMIAETMKAAGWQP